MNNKLLEKLKETYPVGTKVRLLKMDDVQAPPIGTVGTVTHIDDLGTIFCAWETGSSLGVVYGEDIIEKL